MLKLYVRIQDAIKNVHSKEEAQDGFEYLLVSGIVTIAVVAAIASGVLTAAIDAIVTEVKNVVIAEI